MKKLLILSLVILSILGCTAGGPGTLGAVATRELDCSESDIENELNKLKNTDPFKTSIEDTNAVGWWERGGYDFLNYKCMNIKDRLYMITINSENSATADISIRSFYNRKRNEWMFATEFTSTDKQNAEKAMSHLLTYIACE